VPNLLVRVWLPDRPGALGLVASRIGAIGGDIVGVDVLERSERVAVDEFAVVLPREDLVKLLVREIEEVDGASVEEWRLVDQFPDPRLDALQADVAAAVAAAADRREDAALGFDRVRALAAAAAGAPAPASVGLAPDRRRPPRLSEPWFC